MTRARTISHQIIQTCATWQVSAVECYRVVRLHKRRVLPILKRGLLMSVGKLLQTSV